ncbi:hypothetical protein VP01_721g2 [Puccinia sorghi]|uniref:Uncharacterized protein n=1 Tax=Puccinia sorghi TaxID=27349 RepID=A0A0L6UD93_9BASI|nr:hypothetical protein VP01_721g2 [Puccinia sorghi]
METSLVIYATKQVFKKTYYAMSFYKESFGMQYSCLENMMFVDLTYVADTYPTRFIFYNSSYFLSSNHIIIMKAFFTRCGDSYFSRKAVIKGSTGTFTIYSFSTPCTVPLFSCVKNIQDLRFEKKLLGKPLFLKNQSVGGVVLLQIRMGSCRTAMHISNNLLMNHLFGFFIYWFWSNLLMMALSIFISAPKYSKAIFLYTLYGRHQDNFKFLKVHQCQKLSWLISMYSFTTEQMACTINAIFEGKISLDHTGPKGPLPEAVRIKIFSEDLLMKTKQAPQSWIGRYNKVIGGVYQDNTVYSQMKGLKTRSVINDGFYSLYSWILNKLDTTGPIFGKNNSVKLYLGMNHRISRFGSGLGLAIGKGVLKSGWEVINESNLGKSTNLACMKLIDFLVIWTDGGQRGCGLNWAIESKMIEMKEKKNQINNLLFFTHLGIPQHSP